MPRYFLANSLPEPVKDRLTAIQPNSVSGMRLIERQDMHLTLHFLGDVSPQNLEVVCQALTQFKSNSIKLAINGVGRFPPHGQPTVLWAGVDSSPKLTDLHREIGAILFDAIGFQVEARPYSPHITLARLKPTVPAGDIERFLAEHEAFHVSGFSVSEFALYSSVFVDDVPQYREEANFHFTLGSQ